MLSAPDPRCTRVGKGVDVRNCSRRRHPRHFQLQFESKGKNASASDSFIGAMELTPRNRRSCAHSASSIYLADRQRVLAMGNAQEWDRVFLSYASRGGRLEFILRRWTPPLSLPHKNDDHYQTCIKCFSKQDVWANDRVRSRDFYESPSTLAEEPEMQASSVAIGAAVQAESESSKLVLSSPFMRYTLSGPKELQRAREELLHRYIAVLEEVTREREREIRVCCCCPTMPSSEKIWMSV